MYIDTDIAPTKHLLLIKLLFVMMVLALVWWSDFMWWQMFIIAVVAVVCLWRDGASHVPLYALSVKNPDELWELGVYDDRQVWRAYLHDARRIDFGFGRAVRLSFYVVEPHKQPLCVWLFSQSVPTATFRQLSALACERA